MKKFIKNQILKKAAMNVAGLPLLRKFRKASTDCRAAQLKVLRKVVDSSQDTAFGKDHSLGSVKTLQDFRKAVPVRDFEEHRGYVDRMCEGESDVLFPGKPLFYNTTSGSTDKPKLIPVSKEYFSVFNNISRLWLYSCLRDNGRLFNGKNLSAVGPAVEGYVKDGTPYGSISGVTYQNIPSILKDVYSTPYPIICMSDYQKKYYAMMRCGLATSISYIITANPSTLLQFHRTVKQNITDLIRDIHDGTLRSDVLADINPSDRDRVAAFFHPNKERARMLENLARAHGDALKPRHYWPELECINTWKQGNSKLILPKIEGWYPENTSIREFGYMASEARAGLVLGNDWEYSVLLADVYLFEFIEESKRNDSNPDILGAHELEVGKCYYIFITNGSGLFRYDINDIVKVTGFYNQFPLFEFVQKGEGITSLTGEKLSELQVMQALDRVSADSGDEIEFYTMFCDTPNFLYKLFVEFSDRISTVKKSRFAHMVDDQLKSINPEYCAKRESGRLDAPVLMEMGPNSYEAIKYRLLLKGKTREGQYKISCLRKDPEIQRVYESVLLDDDVALYSDQSNCSLV